MIRLNLFVEGQTEESFARSLLEPFLWDYQVITTIRLLGGVVRYSKLQSDLLRWMKEDNNPDACFSRMIDLYRLPGAGAARVQGGAGKVRRTVSL